MLSNPNTWILLSFSIFIIIFAKKAIILSRNFLNNYIDSIKSTITGLEDESTKSEVSVELARKRSAEIAVEIAKLQHEEGVRLRQIKEQYKTAEEKLKTDFNSQYEKDIAIEIKTRKKALMKSFAIKLREETVRHLQAKKFDNNDINLDDLNLKKLLNAQKKTK